MGLSWIRSFKFEERQVFGLDIGFSSVNAVQLQHKKGNGWVVTAANRAKIAPTQEQNRDTNTVKAINECLHPKGFQTRMAVCGVSGPEVAVRDFKFPSLPPEEMESAVIFEASQVCPFSNDDATVDYHVVSTDTDNTSGFLVAARNQLINSRVDLAKQASVDCVLMDVDGLALLNCLSECEQEGADKKTAILNIGHSSTTLAIMSGQGTPTTPFIRDVAYAGNDIVEAIADEHKMTAEAVRQSLFGEDEKSTKGSLSLKDSLEKACQKLIVDVTETLRYHTAQEQSKFVESIFVCGGFAMIQGLVELLDKELPAKVVLWNPFEKIGCTAGPSCEEILHTDGPAMAIAAGLAMRLI
jgi:type IV pilus assembly protein PilM